MANFPILSIEQNNPGIWAANKISDLLEQQQRARLYGEQANWFGPKSQADIDLINKGYIPHFQAQNRLIDEGQIPYNRAQVREINQKLNDPLSKLSSYPELFKAQSLYRHYADTLGEDDPITQDAKKNYSLMQNNAQVLGDWRQAMSETAGIRFLTPEAKSLLEAQQAMAGINPSARTAPAGLPMNPQANQALTNEDRQRIGTNLNQSYAGMPGQINPNEINQPQAPMAASPQGMPQTIRQQMQQPSPGYAPVMTPQETAGLLTSAAIKRSGTANQVNRNIAAKFADVTVGNLMKDEPAMEYYTGAKGRTALTKDRILAASGNSSPEYQSYQRYKTNVALLTAQLRMFYGDSIQPEAAKKLENLANPSAWDKDPETAKESLNAFIKTFEQERKVIQQSLVDPMSVYGEEKGKNPNTLEEANKVINNQMMIPVINSKDQKGKVPADQLDRFLKAGGRRI